MSESPLACARCQQPLDLGVVMTLKVPVCPGCLTPPERAEVLKGLASGHAAAAARHEAQAEKLATTKPELARQHEADARAEREVAARLQAGAEIAAAESTETDT